MRFVHITDTHIGPTPDHIMQGHPTLPNAEALVREINALPFAPDFILHTGDVVDDRSEAAYRLAKPIFEKLNYPIYYVVGNHDEGDTMQRVLLERTPSPGRFDYYGEIHGLALAVFETRGPVDPGGTLTPAQLAAVRDLCKPEGPPLIIAIHHQPVPLDVTWLDLQMPLDCGPEFLEAIAPARERLRGVFFGHVHRAFQVMRDGILLSSAMSATAQITSWPDHATPDPIPHELPGFSIVTITDTETIIRQHTFKRPY